MRHFHAANFLSVPCNRNLDKPLRYYRTEEQQKKTCSFVYVGRPTREGKTEVTARYELSSTAHLVYSCFKGICHTTLSSRFQGTREILKAGQYDGIRENLNFIFTRASAATVDQCWGYDANSTHGEGKCRFWKHCGLRFA